MPSDLHVIAGFPAHVTTRKPILPRLRCALEISQTDISLCDTPNKKNKQYTYRNISLGVPPAPQVRMPNLPSYCMYSTCQSVPLQTSVAWPLLHDGDRKPRICTSECRSGAATKNARS